jgi:hypothetical protein
MPVAFADDPDILIGPCGAPLPEVGRPAAASPTLSEEDDEELEIPEEVPEVGDFEDFDENDFDDEFDEDFEGELEDEYELKEFENAAPIEVDEDDDKELPLDGDFVDEDAEDEPAEPLEAEKPPVEEEKGKKGKAKKKKGRDEDE